MSRLEAAHVLLEELEGESEEALAVVYADGCLVLAARGETAQQILELIAQWRRVEVKDLYPEGE